jgi:hypothetical protein
MLDRWLKCNERNPSQYLKFSVIDATEVAILSSEIREYLTQMLRRSIFDSNFLEKLADYLNWSNVKKMIREKVPIQETNKRGDFGEALIVEILEQFHGYKVPVYKLRYKITSDQRLPATDAIAVKVDKYGNVTEVCFIESKLRTRFINLDCDVATKGCNQLQNDYDSEIPAIIQFVATRLYESSDSLLEPFLSYMRSRIDNTDKDTFRLGLCWERTEWDELVLENLEENNNVNLPKLTVHVIRINNLKQITDELFNTLGIIELSDDD